MRIECPEENLARRLISRHNLRPAIPIFEIARKYAVIEEIGMPFDVDGVSLHLKSLDRKPLIVINSNRGERRKRFTLAHELGHVLIPWHFGTILDITDISANDADDRYWTLESEANRFASELLIPTNWVENLIQDSDDPLELTQRISEEGDVSIQASAIKLIQCLPPGYLFAQVSEDNFVISSSRSHKTIASKLWHGARIEPEAVFQDCSNIFSLKVGDSAYYWWRFDESVSLPRRTTRMNWREILDQIVDDIDSPGIEKAKYKASINGVVAFANSSVKGEDRDMEAVFAAALQRCHGKAGLNEFCSHCLFNEFLLMKVRSFFDLED